MTDSSRRVREALAADVHALDGVVPAADDRSVPVLDEVLASSTVVGFGEATHRTHEIAQLKHRLIRWFVEEHGLRVIGLEAQFPQALALYDYVVDGSGDLDAALAELAFDIHRVEELRALLTWLRSFNEGRPRDDRVELYGFDCQSIKGAATVLGRTLATIAAAEQPAEPVLGDLAVLEDGVIEGYEVDEDRLAHADAVVAALDDWFTDVSDAVLATGDRRPGVVRQLYRCLGAAVGFAHRSAFADIPIVHGYRDERMAATVEWIQAYTDADHLVIWAHDNHVKRGTLTETDGEAASMGQHLADRYDEDYYALGFQFGAGTARAYTQVADGEHEMTELTIPAPDPGTLPGVFWAIDEDVAVLNCRGVDDDDLRAWLRAPRRNRFVAGVIDETDDHPFTREYPPAAFDGIAFIRRVSPTRPL